ncbi:MAG: gamma-glutamyl-gamma-aminobutyrate hydrolase family protein [Tissierellia bacterium]|nr:gamma-glutamyl-gamma-aminobutyrate hydrolase family protein [Tissierellia bacterium]
MKRPVIAATAFYDKEQKYAYMTHPIFRCLERLGAVVLTLPFVEKESEDLYNSLLDRVDGVLFTGGSDLPAEAYGEENRGKVQYPAKPRDRVEFGILPYVIERGIPALGICRGLQLINTHLGGTLYQDLEEDVKTPHLNHEYEVEPYNQIIHKVKVTDQVRAQELFGQTCFGVNSIHHQAIKDLGQGLEILVRSEDNFVEAIHMPNHPFLVGVQWHPEFLYEEEGPHRKILENFIQAAKDYREGI